MFKELVKEQKFKRRINSAIPVFPSKSAIPESNGLAKFLAPSQAGISRSRALKCAIPILLFIALYSLLPVLAAGTTSPWIQTDWSGGLGQTSWSDITKFDSSLKLRMTNSVEGLLANARRISNDAKEGVSNLAFKTAEKTENISNNVSIAIVKFGYLFSTEPTRITSVQETVLSPTSVKISWTTNHPANGKVKWGFKDGDYDFDQQSEKPTTNHEFVLTNLKPNTEYHYEVMSHNKNYVYDANRKFTTPLEPAN